MLKKNNGCVIPLEKMNFFGLVTRTKKKKEKKIFGGLVNQKRKEKITLLPMTIGHQESLIITMALKKTIPL